ncbi:hypothetical protein I79_026280 [Cricetulus griseus]|uniref:Uncharacterized protein n=1 Tax=Cricetulus griseus TaxID=10029 RepID=G3IQE5_CRIGR|nr:hypothetical protein I79_026280 [Cricetulus griseus]
MHFLSVHHSYKGTKKRPVSDFSVPALVSTHPQTLPSSGAKFPCLKTNGGGPDAINLNQ